MSIIEEIYQVWAAAMTQEAPKCNAKTGKIKGCFFIKQPSRYMIKKYGLEKAQEIYLKKYFKTMGIDYPSMKNILK